MYFRKCGDGLSTYLILYVDDMLIAIKDEAEVRNVIDQISEGYGFKDLETTKKIRRMEILRNRKARRLY